MSAVSPQPEVVRFVVLRHVVGADDVHFDLMIDRTDALATWRCPSPPHDADSDGMVCTRLPDHRRLYLDYEGPISGDRGHVERHDHGMCRLVIQGDLDWDLSFQGGRLNGDYRLTGEATGQSWRLFPRSK